MLMRPGILRMLSLRRRLIVLLWCLRRLLILRSRVLRRRRLRRSCGGRNRWRGKSSCLGLGGAFGAIGAVRL
jgi:hypothetical protein